MKAVLLIVVSIFAGVFFALFLVRNTNTRSRRKLKVSGNVRQRGKKKMETTKKVIWICLINGFAWVWCSYILAYLDKVQIAESLSQVAVTEIIGVVLAYCIKSAIENLSKNNHWPDKSVPTEPPLDSDQSGGSGNA